MKTDDDDVSTDDDRSPEYVVSSSSGYGPVKSEETDDEDIGEDNNTSNSKFNVKTEDNDEYSSENKESVRRRKSPRLLTIPTAQSNSFIREGTAIQCTKKKSKRIHFYIVWILFA